MSDPDWVAFPDEKLLEMRICDLGVSIEGTELEQRIITFGERYTSLGKSFAWTFTRQELERRLREPALQIDSMPVSIAA